MEPRANVHKLRSQGKLQEALLLAEAIYEREPSGDTLADYVHLLVQQGFFERAEQALQSSGYSPKSSQGIYLLYVEVYTLAGNANKLRRLHELVGVADEIDLTAVVPIASGGSSLAPDRMYFANQLQHLARSLHEYCPGYEAEGMAIADEIAEGRTADALRSLRSLSDNLDDSGLKYFLRAEISLVEGDYSLAERRFGKLVDAFPRPALILNRLGDICLATGRNAEAKSHYSKAARLDPSDIDTYRDLIRLHLINADVTAAKKAYIQARDRFGNEAVADLRARLTRMDTRDVATVNGLAWFDGGGGLLPIEIDTSAGDGRLHPTGNIGLAMMDSLHLAHRCARRLAETDGASTVTSRQDVTVNVPMAPIHKDGPSAGLAFAVGIHAILAGRKLPVRQGFTGEITLSGNVLPVGGIPGKLGAAYFADLERVFVPAENLGDVFRISNRVKSALTIHPCSSIDQVLETLWPN